MSAQDSPTPEPTDEVDDHSVELRYATDAQIVSELAARCRGGGFLLVREVPHEAAPADGPNRWRLIVDYRNKGPCAAIGLANLGTLKIQRMVEGG